MLGTRKPVHNRFVMGQKWTFTSSNYVSPVVTTTKKRIRTDSSSYANHDHDLHKNDLEYSNVSFVQNTPCTLASGFSVNVVVVPQSY